MTGHACTDIDAATSNIPPSPIDTSTRECSLRELILARALYRCGDYDGLGEKILTQYAQDLRGHYARHALAVLGREEIGDPGLGKGRRVAETVSVTSRRNRYSGPHRTYM